MLYFHRSQISQNEDTARIETIVTENFPDGKSIDHCLWCETGIEYAEYLCTERCDALLIGLLPYAILKGHDISSDTPATLELLYKIKEIWLPLLLQTSKKAHPIRLNIPTANDKLPNQCAVGTGVSLGIDSLYTIQRHTQNSDSLLKLTHLGYFNVGSHGRGTEATRLNKAHLQKVQAFAREYNYKLVVVNSNLMDEFRQHHAAIDMYTSAFAVFSLQKLWSDYSYASAGYFPGNNEYQDWERKNCADYYLVLQGIISTSNLRFHADAEDATRFQKTASLSNSLIAQKHLYVCTRETDNCCRCKKCVRTILTLKALGVRDRFNHVFDPQKESFWSNLKGLLKGIRKRDCYIMEIVKYFFSNKKKHFR
ncbi:MAG: hypothetical protein MJ033_07070 [Victivallaceae bacterium]|nr:hypothetical protein [Victivallaceae bacterium]